MAKTAFTMIAMLFTMGTLTDATKQCVDFDGSKTLPSVISKLHIDMPQTGFVLEGNALGQENRTSDLHQCVFTGDNSSFAFGWSWQRGATNETCMTGNCSVPTCLSQFSMLNARYGTSPLSGKSSGAKHLPVQHSELAALPVSLNVDYTWEDVSPGSKQPYRSSFLLDMFLSSEEPTPGHAVGHSITDEIVVDISYNPGYAPACNQFGKRPLQTFDAGDGNKYDFMVSRYGDMPTGRPDVKCRMNHFRRVGGAGVSVPSRVDLLPIIQFVNNYNQKTSGMWLGDITFGSALYDNEHGQVLFPSFPAVKPVKKSETVVV